MSDRTTFSPGCIVALAAFFIVDASSATIARSEPLRAVSEVDLDASGERPSVTTPIEFSPDGQLLRFGFAFVDVATGTIKQHSATTKRRGWEIPICAGFLSNGDPIFVSSDGRRVQIIHAFGNEKEVETRIIESKGAVRVLLGSQHLIAAEAQERDAVKLYSIFAREQLGVITNRALRHCVSDSLFSEKFLRVASDESELLFFCRRKSAGNDAWELQRWDTTTGQRIASLSWPAPASEPFLNAFESAGGKYFGHYSPTEQVVRIADSNKIKLIIPVKLRRSIDLVRDPIRPAFSISSDGSALFILEGTYQGPYGGEVAMLRKLRTKNGQVLAEFALRDNTSVLDLLSAEGIGIGKSAVMENLYPWVKSCANGYVVAIDGGGNGTGVFEVATKQQVGTLPGYGCAKMFSVDGKRLATVDRRKRQIRIWAVVADEHGNAKLRTDVEYLWNALGSNVPTEARWAVSAAIDYGEAIIPLLTERMKASPVDSDMVQSLLRQLGDDEFENRRVAFGRLKAIGYGSRKLIENAIASSKSPEIRASCKRLLHIQDDVTLNQTLQRRLRCVEILDCLGSREAELTLQKLANQGDTYPVTQWARRAIAQ